MQSPSGDDPSRTTSVGLARYSQEYLEAALAVDDKMGLRTGFEINAPTPVMFLVGQSVELALKAFLLHKGVDLGQLRQYGHDLHRSLRKAKELGLFELVQFSAEESLVVRILDDLYRSKRLQYIRTGAATYPAFGPLQRAALKLARAVGQEVGFPANHLPNAL